MRTRPYPKWQYVLPDEWQNVVFPWLSIRKLRTHLERVKARRDEYAATIDMYSTRTTQLEEEIVRLKATITRQNFQLMARAPEPLPADHSVCEQEIDGLSQYIDDLENEVLALRQANDTELLQAQIVKLQGWVEDLTALESADGCPKVRYRIREEAERFCEFMKADANQDLEPYRCPSCRQLGVRGAPRLWHVRHVDPGKRGQIHRDEVKLEQAAFRRANRGLSHRLTIPTQ